jgi:hypothetical protein
MASVRSPRGTIMDDWGGKYGRVLTGRRPGGSVYLDQVSEVLVEPATCSKLPYISKQCSSTRHRCSLCEEADCTCHSSATEHST